MSRLEHPKQQHNTDRRPAKRRRSARTKKEMGGKRVNEEIQDRRGLAIAKEKEKNESIKAAQHANGWKIFLISILILDRIYLN